MEFSKVRIPEGDLIEVRDGQLVTGDRPVIGCLRGDGIGLDITPVMQNEADMNFQVFLANMRDAHCR